jgi:TRAP transporter 4TM/12TM fusion protein
MTVSTETPPIDDEVESRAGTGNFRKLTGRTHWLANAILFSITAIGLIWATDFNSMLPFTILTEQFLALFWTLILSSVFLVVKAHAAEERSTVPWFDWILIILALVSGLYLAIDYERLLYESPLLTVDKWLAGLVSIVLLIEATRRLAGNGLLIILLLFLAYGLVAHFVPAPLKGPTVRWERLLVYLYIDTNALIGLPLLVAAKIVLAFVVLGNLMFATGGARFFTDLAMVAMGRYRGGPAKISVLASSLFGSISGTAVSNVVTTGVVTIPLMKKNHYRAETAAAIEAVASTGGQIMPPVLGATSFLMAEFLQLPFRDVVLASIFPALLYYVLVFLQIDLEAGKFNLSGIDRSLLPKAGAVLREGWLFVIPLAVLIYTLFVLHFSAGKAGLSAVITVFLLSCLRKKSRLSVRQLAGVLVSSGIGLLEIGVIVGIAGVIIGVLNLTSLGFNLSVVMIQIGGQSQVVLLLLAALLAVILGMGMPTVSVYLLLAVLIGPALVEVGFNPLAAHMFLLYTGMLSMLSPPVAIASFTAASIAGANPMQTSWISLRLGAMAFIAPFVFV